MASCNYGGAHVSRQLNYLCFRGMLLFVEAVADREKNEVLQRDTGDSMADLGIIRSPQDQKRRDEGTVVCLTACSVIFFFQSSSSNNYFRFDVPRAFVQLADIYQRSNCHFRFQKDFYNATCHFIKLCSSRLH